MLINSLAAGAHRKSMAYFYATFYWGWNTRKSVIPLKHCSIETLFHWNNVVTNIGNKLVTTSGIFTAPSSGVYLFIVTGYANAQYTRLFLDLNGSHVSSAWSNELYSSYAMQNVLGWKAGDQVNVWLEEGSSVGVQN